ncbi:exonuclease SbcCD subunit D [Anaeromicrobium sediminis]|uniref:Nuclease SbcCD subunit D n=1 Tax=Anaeromicrobium sediminis TaxID=1478221 RepID=A0A267MD95_9FIRM|nr:exonuclease SbcCD subunit D [Anaeromicrobium sediminis]PAB57526.1 exonuclease sbcCD subunit D [Anaeromicrobium sediminis]
MKIIHTADWHIGKLVHGIHMTEDQAYILEEFIKLIEIEKPQVVIIGGDLYDRSIPPVEAVELLDYVFTRIIDMGVKIVAIGGNHDSADRVSFGNKILKNKGLYIEGKIKDTIEPIKIEDEYGPVNFYLLPYADPVIVREVYKNEEVKSHDMAMKVIIDKIKENMNKDERNILVCHSFLRGDSDPETSESELPLSIGGSEYVSVDHFLDFDYVALGHLHRPQRVKEEKIRYSGSLLKYSFSETTQNKSVTLIDMKEDGQVEIKFEKLKTIRDMRKIKGEINKLLDPSVYEGTNCEDYIMAILTDEGEIIDPIGKLRQVYPNILRIERESRDESENTRTSASREYTKKSLIDLFDEFYASMTKNEFDEEKTNTLISVIETLKGEGREV